MINAGKKNVLGVQINAVDYEAAVSRIIAAAKERQSLSVSALAVHGVMTGVLDPMHRFRLNHMDLVVPDGQPVKWALNLLHKTNLMERVYGPTLTLKVCERAADEKLPVYFYGSTPETLQKLLQKLTVRFPGIIIAGSQASRFRCVTDKEKRDIAKEIRESGAQLVLVGLGCPRQEVWAFENRDILSMPILAVGAAFDFHAGVAKQAPPVLQRLGLEWFFRFTQEPIRLWRRYVLLNPLFLMLLLLQFFGLKRFYVDNIVPPNQELRYG
ncbi:MAG: glycosyltransferase [Anaerolineaceae bacterium]|nr:glycosyltransferase [Anaerolineaceae bacterium]